MKSVLKHWVFYVTFVAALVGHSQLTCRAQEIDDSTKALDNAAKAFSSALSGDDAKREQNARAIELYNAIRSSEQPRVAPWQAIQTATNELRDAPDDAAKAAARKKLVDLLAQFFDADMKNRQAQLQAIEERVKKLRSQFDKRASKKQEILDLQLKLLENEADGLGFFGSPAGAAPMTGSPYGMPMNGGFGPGQPGMMGNVLFEGGPVGPPMLMNPSSMEPEGGLPTMPGAINRAAPPQPGGAETTIRSDAKPVPRRNSPSENTEPAPKR